MQATTAAKKHKKGLQASSNVLQPTTEFISVRDQSTKDNKNSSFDYVMSPATFNLKYKHEVAEYIRAMRLKKGLDTVPKQTSVLPTSANLEHSHFIYCLILDQIKNVKFDPYTLVMVSPAKVNSYSSYFTASTWSITEVKCQ